ncbi:MAG: hypothetical protein RL558_1244, partial [Bacteroidota bacterium]
MHKKLAFVVASTAGKNGSVGVDRRGAHLGLKGWSGPQIEGVSRLHVVVSVDQHRRATRIHEVLSINDRIPRRRADFYLLGACFSQKVGNGIGRGEHRIFVGRVGRNTGQAQKRKKFVEKALSVLGNVGINHTSKVQIMRTTLCILCFGIMPKIALIIALIIALGFGLNAKAQNIVVNSTSPRNDPMWLVQNVLVGPNFLVYSPLNQFGLPLSQPPSVQLGKFTCANSAFGLDSGIVMV